MTVSLVKTAVAPRGFFDDRPPNVIATRDDDTETRTWDLGHGEVMELIAALADSDNETARTFSLYLGVMRGNWSLSVTTQD